MFQSQFMGWLLVLFSLLIPILSYLYRPHYRRSVLIRDLWIAIALLFSGILLVPYGWRLPLLLQFQQLLLSEIILGFWMKDIFQDH